VDGGPIGGIKQTGKWKLTARYNKAELRRRCEKVAEYRDRIKVSGIDGIDFIEAQDKDATLFFIDPPYFAKGSLLYLNALDDAYHKRLAGKLKAMKRSSWVLTYDDCAEIRALYSDWASIRPFSLRYSASERRSGKEILITPKWMRMPSSQRSAAIHW
jgi:DNA adenine methylase